MVLLVSFSLHFNVFYKLFPEWCEVSIPLVVAFFN